MDSGAVKTFIGFAGRIIVIQVITYWLIGFILFATGIHTMVFFQNYRDPIVALYMQVLRPNDSLIIQAGSLFPPIRGLIFALVLFPFRRIFIEAKYGWVYLWCLFLVLAQFSTIGPGDGSLEGAIYTQLPAVYHLIVLPEGVIQTLLFSLLVVTWEEPVIYG